MPAARLCSFLIRTLAKHAIGIAFCGAIGLFTLDRLGVSLNDIRRGDLVPALMSSIMQQSCTMNGIPALDEASLAGMLDQADLADPGAIQTMLRANGSLLATPEQPQAKEDPTPRGVVIFSPNSPENEPDAKGNKPAPIVRVHQREAG